MFAPVGVKEVDLMSKSFGLRKRAVEPTLSTGLGMIGSEGREAPIEAWHGNVKDAALA